MKRKYYLITSLLVFALITTRSGYSEILNLKNPDWQDVPGTEWDGLSAAIEMNGLTRNGDMFTFDLLGADLHYARIELNCTNKRYRVLREGSPDKKGRIRFENVKNSGWKGSKNNHIHFFTKVVCGS